MGVGGCGAAVGDEVKPSFSAVGWAHPRHRQLDIVGRSKLMDCRNGARRTHRLPASAWRRGILCPMHRRNRPLTTSRPGAAWGTTRANLAAQPVGCAVRLCRSSRSAHPERCALRRSTCS
eukprot:7336914-Prymnesium_polylepis.1